MPTAPPVTSAQGPNVFEKPLFSVLLMIVVPFSSCADCSDWLQAEDWNHSRIGDFA